VQFARAALGRAGKSQHTCKEFGLRAAIRVDARGRSFSDDAAIACHDFGRGVWPYRTRWFWAVLAQGDVAANLGGEWTRGTGVTENGVVDRGRLRRLPCEIDFHVDRAVPDRPWRLASPEVDLTFSPLFTRRLRVNAVVLASDLLWGFGRFAGRLSAPGGKTWTVDGALGFAEEHRARW
jgi:hypothetical protein